MPGMDVRKFVNGKLQTCSASSETSPGEDNKENQVTNVPEVPSLDSLVSSQPFLVISIGNCPQCEELAAFLAALGVPSEVFVKWDKTAAEYPELKKQLAAHAGEIFTFPQVFANATYQGGFKEVMDKAKQGAYDDLFEREFDMQPVTLKRWVERQPMVVFSLPDCPQCDVLYEDLKKRGVPVQDVFAKLDKAKPEYPSMKAQMQRLIGRDQFAFPQTFVRGVHQGDFDEVIARADKEELADFFQEEFGIAPPMPAQESQPVDGAIAFDEDF